MTDLHIFHVGEQEVRVKQYTQLRAGDEERGQGAP